MKLKQETHVHLQVQIVYIFIGMRSIITEDDFDNEKTYKDQDSDEDEELADDISCLSINGKYSYDIITAAYKPYVGRGSQKLPH
eukprot:11607673-Ditylum_brightwellii.AAC.1